VLTSDSSLAANFLVDALLFFYPYVVVYTLF
jgi:hypothetical protein